MACLCYIRTVFHNGCGCQVIARIHCRSTSTASEKPLLTHGLWSVQMAWPATRLTRRIMVCHRPGRLRGSRRAPAGGRPGAWPEALHPHPPVAAAAAARQPTHRSPPLASWQLKCRALKRPTPAGGRSAMQPKRPLQSTLESPGTRGTRSIAPPSITCNAVTVRFACFLIVPSRVSDRM